MSQSLLRPGRWLTLAALAFVLAVPASAAGEDFEISPGGQMEFSGEVGFNTLGSTIECETQATANSEGEATSVTKFDVSSEDCTLTGEYESCELQTVGAVSSLPWDVQVNSEDLMIEDAKIGYTLNESCPGGWLVIANFPELTATPDDPEAIGSLALSGEGILQLAIGSYQEYEEHELPTEALGTLTRTDERFSGEAGFNSLGSTVECETQMTLSSEGEATSVTKFGVSSEDCTLTGEYEGCELQSAGPGSSLPWDVQVNSEDLTIEDARVAYFLNESCPGGWLAISNVPELTATPDDPEAIGSLVLSGEGILELAIGTYQEYGEHELPMEAIGTLERVQSGISSVN